MTLLTTGIDYTAGNGRPPVPAQDAISLRGPMAEPDNHWNLNGLVFDAWLRLKHSSSTTITQHPVEVGNNIADYNFLNNTRFSFEIGMSDCAQSIIPGQFPPNPTRSINAYNAVIGLQASRQFLTLVSKYGYFRNILIESIDASDDYRTVEGARVTINLMQVMVASEKLMKVSANPQATDQTNRGTVQAIPLPGTWQAVINDLNKFTAQN